MNEDVPDAVYEYILFVGDTISEDSQSELYELLPDVAAVRAIMKKLGVTPAAFNSWKAEQPPSRLEHIK